MKYIILPPLKILLSILIILYILSILTIVNLLVFIWKFRFISNEEISMLLEHPEHTIGDIEYGRIWKTPLHRLWKKEPIRTEELF